MQNFLDKMIELASSDKKRIVLPEGGDNRTLEAAKKISSTNSTSA